MAKIDFKAAVSKMAAHAAGAAAYTQLNKLAFMKNIGLDKATGKTKGPIKGLVTALIGYVAIPMIADKLKIGGSGKKGDMIKNVGEGIGIIGVMQAGYALVPPKDSTTPGLFPNISGIEDVYGVEGLGMITEEDDSDVSGYESSPIRVGDTTYDDSPVRY